MENFSGNTILVKISQTIETHIEIVCISEHAPMQQDRNATPAMLASERMPACMLADFQKLHTPNT